LKEYQKRAFDFSLALNLLIVFFIPMLIIAFLVKITSSGPALYWSRRVGRYGQYFMMPKFRSMLLETPQVATDQLLEPSKYLSSIGYFLRKTSLDELPQLWCIVKGEMSFVGPRPALFNQDELISRRKNAGVDNLRPGLTGWAQVNGRDELPITAKLAFDIEYAHCQSFFFDIKIIWKTLFKVISQDGISH
jgi:O-antigen biosynthesis protein WbqP